MDLFVLITYNNELTFQKTLFVTTLKNELTTSENPEVGWCAGNSSVAYCSQLCPYSFVTTCFSMLGMLIIHPGTEPFQGTPEYRHFLICFVSRLLEMHVQSTFILK